MTSEPSKDRGQKGSSAEQLRKHRERLLDEALNETFPASDPPSIAWPRSLSVGEEANRGAANSPPPGIADAED